MEATKDGIKLIGNGHWIPTDYGKPEWSDEEELFFKYKGEVYWLSEFLCTDNISPLSSFDGYASDSFFSGVVIKLDDEGEYVKAYTYIS
jgi:hypothetical protein